MRWGEGTKYVRVTWSPRPHCLTLYVFYVLLVSRGFFMYRQPGLHVWANIHGSVDITVCGLTSILSDAAFGTLDTITIVGFVFGAAALR